MQKRGIILTHQMDPTTRYFSGNIDPSELRKHLLYWDFIDFPTVNWLGANLEAQPEAKLLKEQGFLFQSSVNNPKLYPLNGGINNMDPFKTADMLLKGQFLLYKEYIKKDILCSLSQYNVNLETPLDFQEKISVLEMEMINCLPYPTEEIQIAEILEFKEKRKDELLNLRSKMDEIYQIAIIDIQNLRTRNITIDKFKKSILDINKLFDENKFKRKFFNFKVLLKIQYKLFSGYLVGTELASIANFPIIESGIIGASLAAILNINPKEILGPNDIPDNLKDFAYLYQAKKYLT